MKSLRNFRIDRQGGKVLGVCAGIANLTGWDVTFVRVATVLLMLIGPFPWTLIPYGLLAFFGRQQSAVEEAAYARPLPRATEEVMMEARAMNARAAEIESAVASEDSSLAREIEKLRQS